MKHPNTGIIRHEPDNEVPLRRNDKSIPARRDARESGMVGRIVGNGVDAVVFVVEEVFAVGREAVDELEVVAVHVEGVGACVVVVEDEVYDLVVFEDEGVGAFAVDRRVCG